MSPLDLSLDGDWPILVRHFYFSIGGEEEEEMGNGYDLYADQSQDQTSPSTRLVSVDTGQGDVSFVVNEEDLDAVLRTIRLNDVYSFSVSR